MANTPSATYHSTAMLETARDGACSRWAGASPPLAGTFVSGDKNLGPAKGTTAMF